MNGELRTEGNCVIRGTWEGTQTLRLELAAVRRCWTAPGGMVCVERGPLVSAVPIEAEYRRHEYDRDGGWNAGIPTAIMSCCPTPWKYALASGELEAEERERGCHSRFLPLIPCRNSARCPGPHLLGF